MAAEFTYTQLLLITPVIFAGGVLQGTAGFGFVLLVLPLLVLIELPLSHAVALASVATCSSALVGSWRLRHFIPWKDVWFATTVRYLAIPVGTWLLTYLNGYPDAQIRQTVGLFILLSIAIPLLLRFEPRENLAPLWGLIAFGSSGVIHGMIAMGGPPVVLWVSANSWNGLKSRAFLLTTFLLALPMQLLMLYLAFGAAVLHVAILAVIYFPLSFMGTYLGIWLGNRLGKKQLRMLSYVMLFAISARCFF